MTALGAATASSTQEIADGLEKFASVADTVGLSYEYATSALATIVAETRQSADVVGTALRTLFARIQGLNLGETLDDGTTLNKYSEALATVGISIKEQNGDLKDMDDILNELGAKWESLSNDQQVALAQTVAGVRQYNQLIALMDNWDVMQENLATAADSAGTLQEQQDTYMESLEGHLNQLTAAEEHLYDAMFDSDTFKDLIDMLTGLVNGMGDFVDAIGGGGNALMLLGTVATNIFDKKIAQGLTNIINNSKVAATNLKNLTEQQRLLEAVSAQASTDKSTSGRAQFKGTQIAVEEHSRMMGSTDILTPDQIEEGNNLIRIYSDATAKVEELNLKQKEAAQTLKEILVLTKEDDYKNTRNSTFEKAIGTDNKKSQVVIDNYNEQMGILKDNVEEAKDSVSELFKDYKDFTKGSIKNDPTDKLVENLDAFKDKLTDLSPILSKNLQKQIENLNFDFLSEDFEKQCKNIIKVGENAFNELQTKDEQIQSALVNANNNAIQVAQSQADSAKTSLSQWFSNLDLTSTIRAFTDMASAASGVYMAFQSIQGLGNIWSNDDLTATEKIAQSLFLTSTLMTSIVPLLKTIQTGYKTLTTVQTLYNLAKTKELTQEQLHQILEGKSIASRLTKIAIEKLLGMQIVKTTTEEGAETLALVANTAAQQSSNIAKAISNALHGDFSGLALVAIGLIAAGTVALIANTNAQKKDNEEKEKANKLETDLKDTNDALKESYENLKNAFDAYDVANDKLESCIKGTQE